MKKDKSNKRGRGRGFSPPKPPEPDSPLAGNNQMLTLAKNKENPTVRSNVEELVYKNIRFEVTWVEHIETEEKEQTHELYREMIHKGIAFGAERWVTTLQRMCERFASLLAPAKSSRDLGGVIPSPSGKRSMMRLAQRMVSNYCLSVSRSNITRSTVVAEVNEVGIHVTAQKSPEPNGTILCAATTFWLPSSPQNVFNFLKDERTRPQVWDLGGQDRLRTSWATYYRGTHAVIVVIDSTDRAMIYFMKDELSRLLGHTRVCKQEP